MASPPTPVVGDALHRVRFGEFVSFRVEHVVVWGFLPALPPFPSPQPFPCTERDRSITPLFLKRRRLVATHRLDCRGERPSDRFVQKATGFVHPIPSAVVPFTQPFPCTEHDRSIVPLFLKRRRLVVHTPSLSPHFPSLLPLPQRLPSQPPLLSSPPPLPSSPRHPSFRPLPPAPNGTAFAQVCGEKREERRLTCVGVSACVCLSRVCRC